jgi:hypothetical protein
MDDKVEKGKGSVSPFLTAQERRAAWLVVCLFLLGLFEWTAPAILFACLVFTLTAPLYIWQIIGI